MRSWPQRTSTVLHPVLLLPLLLLLSTLYPSGVTANVEKTVFLAPVALTIADTQPSIEALCLDSLTPTNSMLYRELAVSFASKEKARGRESWYLLRDLVPGQRFEVRVCWAATEPTEFWLDTFTLPQIFESQTGELISALGEYAQSQYDRVTACPKAPAPPKNNKDQGTNKESLLFLRIQAAADFFSPNKTLMNSPPAVGVEIILDPFIGNILPKSLVSTAVAIVGAALLAWFVSGMVLRHLRDIARVGEGKAHVE